MVAQAGEPIHERVVPGAAVQALELVALALQRVHFAGDRHAEPGEQERQSERGQQQNDRGDPGMAGVLVREGSDRRHADEDAERQRQRPDQPAADPFDAIRPRAGLALQCGRGQFSWFPGAAR